MSNIIDEFVALVKWKVDASGLDGMTKTATNLKNQLVGIGKALSPIPGELAKIASAAAVMAGLKTSIDLAADAEESLAAYAAVFDTLEDKGGGALRTIADDLKLADSTASRLLSGTGGLLQGIGAGAGEALEFSKQVARIGADLAAFNNYQGGTEGAADAVTKALLGERESLKTLKIAISEEDITAQIALNTKRGMRYENEKLAKAYATLELIQARGVKQMGTYARESGGYTARVRAFREQLKAVGEVFGEILLPVLVDIMKAATPFLMFLKESPAWVRTLIVGGAALAIVLGPLIMVFAQLAFGLWSLSTAAAAAGTTIGGYLVAQLRIGIAVLRRFAVAAWGALVPLLPYIAAVAAIVAVIALWGSALAVLIDDFKVWKDGGSSALGSLWEGFERLKAKALEFWENIRPGLVFLGGLLLAAGRIIGIVLVAAWELLKQKAGEFWAFVQPILEGWVGILAAVGRVLLPLGQWLFDVLGPAFQWVGNLIGEAFGSALDLLTKIWDSAPVRFIRDNLKKISDFGYTGEWNSESGAGAGAAATSTSTRYMMAGAGNNSTYNAGGFQLSFGGTNASPDDIRAATSSAMVDGFRMVERNNGGRP